MKYTFVAKTSSGLVKAWATGKDKKGTKEYCLKQLKDRLHKKIDEAYEQAEYRVVQVDNNDWIKEIDEEEKTSEQKLDEWREASPALDLFHHIAETIQEEDK